MKQLVTLKITSIILFLAMGIIINAQDKNEFKEKLSQLKGNIDKVTVKVDGKEVVFEGKDAEKLVNIVKPMAGKKVMWFNSNDDDWDFDDSAMMVHVSDGDDTKGEGKKKVQVEIKDGKKQITVTTTNKEGKEETKSYEGEEAEKFIKEQGANVMPHKRIKIITDGDDEDGNVFMFNKRSGCGCCCGGMHMMNMPGTGKHKIIMKMMDDDDDVIIKKKVDKKSEMKTEKKEEKK